MSTRPLLGLLLCGACSSPTPPATLAVDASQCSCHDDFNLNAAPTGDTVGVLYMAFQYRPTCTFDGTALDIYTTSTVFSIFSDSNGQPDAFVVKDVPSQPFGSAGLRRATIAAQFNSSSTYWIAIKNTGGGIDQTVSPLAKTGTTASYYGGAPGVWTNAGRMAPFIFSVSGNCP